MAAMQTEHVGVLRGLGRFVRCYLGLHRVAMQAGAWETVCTCSTDWRRWMWKR